MITARKVLIGLNWTRAAAQATARARIRPRTGIKLSIPVIIPKVKAAELNPQIEMVSH